MYLEKMLYRIQFSKKNTGVIFYLVTTAPPLKDLPFVLCVSPRTTEVPLPDRICHCLHG